MFGYFFPFNYNPNRGTLTALEFIIVRNKKKKIVVAQPLLSTVSGFESIHVNRTFFFLGQQNKKYYQTRPALSQKVFYPIQHS